MNELPQMYFGSIKSHERVNQSNLKTNRSISYSHLSLSLPPLSPVTTQIALDQVFQDFIHSHN